MTNTSQEWKFTTKDIAEKPDLFLSGHRACAGCGPASVIRLIMKATRGPTIVTEATGCMEVVSSIYPYTSWALPWLHTAFETAAANASGIEAALKVMRKKGRVKDEHVDIIAIAGDGGTYDIGLQALSGAVERGHDFLFVLYDNEGYMNTGIQRSGGTPKGAATTTTPAGKVIPEDGSEEAHRRNHDSTRNAIRRHGFSLLLARPNYQSAKRLGSRRTSVPSRFCSVPKRVANRTRENDGVRETGSGVMRLSSLGGDERQAPTVHTEQADCARAEKEEAYERVLEGSGTLQAPVYPTEPEVAG